MKHWTQATDAASLRAAVEVLKQDVERAYWECRDEEAGAAHDDLVSAEWRLRQAERMAK